MYRSIIAELIKWKENPNKKPLIIKGARQVGKTYIMKEFSKDHYKNSVYINFENNSIISNIFESDFNIKNIILGLETYSNSKIDKDTLIIFDEIQECPKALTSLKYFYENAPEYQIMVAGSMLGVALHKETSFPVGKVEFLNLYPLTFKEFLLAKGEEKLVSLLESKNYSLITSFKDRYIKLLKEYYFIGGMPEAVQDFVINENFDRVREIQNRILASYEQDFSKHAPNNVVPRIRLLWNSIPAQLAKENKKFVYGMIKSGARSKEYEDALLWLYDCGLIYKINRISKPNLPLKAYEDAKAFKLFLFDVGLLGAMVNLSKQTIIDGNEMFVEFKGILTEQYVLQELIFNKLPTYYWSSEKGIAEIDFLTSQNDKIIPIEVKAETNLKAKSLKVYREKFSPEVSCRISMADYKEEEGLINLPLYMVSEFMK